MSKPEQRDLIIRAVQNRPPLYDAACKVPLAKQGVLYREIVEELKGIGCTTIDGHPIGKWNSMKLTQLILDVLLIGFYQIVCLTIYL